jgi:hypothetical protein
MSMSTPAYADEHAVAGAVIGEACAIARRQNGPPVVGLAIGKHHTLVDVGPPMSPSFQVKAPPGVGDGEVPMPATPTGGLLVAAWHVLTTHTSYHDLGGDYFIARDNPEHRRRRALLQLERLGYRVTLEPVVT